MVTRIHCHRTPVTIAGPLVFGIIGHSLALRNANNPHDRVVDPVHGRITGVWALN